MTSHRVRGLELFCGAGGAGVGYTRAGCDIGIGVDIRPQPNYPFEFRQDDAFNWCHRYGMPRLALEFDFVHASPPCQEYTKAGKIYQRSHPDLIGQTRELLEWISLPYVIENVPGAPLIDPVVLEGQMFPELRTHRPRWFECSFPVDVDFMRGPRPARQAKMGRKPKPDEWMQVVGHFSDVKAGREAMGIPWMTRDELAQAIPPAYTERIGRSLVAHLEQVAA